MYKTLNIFDFDGTLFNSPVPNPELWNKKLYGALENSYIAKGYGWYINPITLDYADPRQFNEEIVNKVNESNSNKDCLTVLLTGRNIANSTKIKELVKLKGLEFDYMFFKRNYNKSTFDMKIGVIKKFLYAHSTIDNINIYDDRDSQIKKFNNYKKFSSKNINVIKCVFSKYHMPEFIEKHVVRELLLSEKVAPKIHLIDLEDEDCRTFEFSIVFDKHVSTYLNNEFYDIIPFDWIPKNEHHMTISTGNPCIDSMSFIEKYINKEVEITCTRLGLSDEAIAISVDTELPSCSAVKHITLGHSAYSSPYYSNDIKYWIDLEEEIKLTGKVSRVFYTK